MRLFGKVNSAIDRYDRAAWLTMPFDLNLRASGTGGMARRGMSDGMGSQRGESDGMGGRRGMDDGAGSQRGVSGA